MSRKAYDPLSFVPQPDTVRKKLHETLTLAERLKALLDLSEKLHIPLVTANTLQSGNATGLS